MSSDADSTTSSPAPDAADAAAPDPAGGDAVESQGTAAPEFPMARRAPVRRWASWAWALPVVALAVSGVWVSDYLGKRGYEITVRFKHGNGIKVGDSLKHRGVAVGNVIGVKLARDLGRVDVKLVLMAEAKHLAVPGSRFWIERPKLTLSEVRGLDTILGARYLAVRPGKYEGVYQRKFQGIEDPPVLVDRQPGGLEIVLESDERRSLERGAPVIYRGVGIGIILSVGLASDGVVVESRAYIAPAYRQLVRDNTRFWNVSGVDMDWSLFGGWRLDVGSLQTIATGGVALATPTKAGGAIKTGHRFKLFDKFEKEWLTWRPRLPVGSSLLPVGAAVPHPLRISLSWKTSGVLGFGTKTATREGWILPLDRGLLLGPANLLQPVADSKDNKTLLSVAGREFELSAEAAKPAGHLIVYDAGAAALKIDHPWPRMLIRRPEKSEDCLIIGDARANPIALSEARIEVKSDHWALDRAISLDRSWHGASVVSRSDGRLIGMFVFEGGKGRIVPVQLPSQ